MAVTVGNRVQSMIDHMEKGELDLALSDICIALTSPLKSTTKDLLHQELLIKILLKKTSG